MQLKKSNSPGKQLPIKGKSMASDQSTTQCEHAMVCLVLHTFDTQIQGLGNEHA